MLVFELSSPLFSFVPGDIFGIQRRYPTDPGATEVPYKIHRVQQPVAHSQSQLCQKPGQNWQHLGQNRIRAAGSHLYVGLHSGTGLRTLDMAV